MSDSRKLRIPSLCHHKATGRAVVRLNGLDYYLGEHGTAESKAAYDRLIAEWLARGRLLGSITPFGPAIGITINSLILAFWKHAEQHYRHKDGTPTSEMSGFLYSLRALRRLYGELPVTEFSPSKLKAVRSDLIRNGIVRKSINQRIGRIKRVFKWGVSEELVPVAVFQSLCTVTGLQQGRTAAPEPEPVLPVAAEDIAAVLPLMPSTARAMVQIQQRTGMRPGEVCVMRPSDIDRSGPVWIYRPSQHKTAWRGKGRVIAVGPQAQEILLPFLEGRLPEAFLFSPRMAVLERNAVRRVNRKSKVQPSQRDRGKHKPRKVPSEKYTSHAYAHVIGLACRKAGIPNWSPNRLRHSYATEVRKKFGLEAAQCVLGHASADVTQIYAERDLTLAVKVAAAIG